MLPATTTRRWNTLSRVTALLAIVATTTISLTNAFYLPGVAPTEYHDSDPVFLMVNALTPGSDSELKSVIPYDYYYPMFHFCKPKDGERSQAESLGSILFGDRIWDSPFRIRMRQPKSCEKLCEVDVSTEEAKFINNRIRENYVINWLIDGLPVGHIRQGASKGDQEKQVYSIGFPLGVEDGKETPKLNNHYEINVEFHHNKQKDTLRVVGVTVEPFSIENAMEGSELCGSTQMEQIPGVYLSEKQPTHVTYTYAVHWQEVETAWATRWDKYLMVGEPRIHWFSLVNSVIIVLFLTGMVAMVLLRALHKDISRYNQQEAQEDFQEDFGWKLVHGDVFRPPAYPMLLSIIVGNGTQMFLMAAVTILFAALGFLSPSNRGSLATVMIVFYMFFGIAAGFVSARLYKMFGGEAWKMNVIGTAFLFPGVIFTGFVALNFFLIGAKSSGAVPFGTMVGLVALWFLVSTPLSVVGSYLGFQRPKIETPVRANQIPRQIPDQVFYLRPIPSMLVGGILPFGAIFIELYFILNSIWFRKIYYVFGFLFLVFGILILTCAEVTILMCYFHLCAEDYHWWWRAFFTSGASAIYIFLYSIMYYFTSLQIKSFTSVVLYFGWTAIMSIMFFVLSGAIGFFSTFAFVRKIYGSIKID
ncbi:hypothetical protein BX616_002595 [Lobosporangium transversale]|uniref:Transmembrane 9 superfamily member n=1 Tax=Lobosporangium transversale TaxID=64571 RepID=A0A1Y2GH16_9FUNG|nr:hypothetical protein BCR41DRAFT_338787 [Lobosporangium transversale]KAF9900433.1 hypothetical protein BX616_002595 [Lobosporangium transversale]ORZ10676.1 hypothetical protein BCR41DRAFT_338787 [Lobosporangium transversale]|eukprot:XP_021879397.1 hypothetical protein BCR41DRAFT_338787 [Lobosporangium transversale]